MICSPYYYFPNRRFSATVTTCNIVTWFKHVLEKLKFPLLFIIYSQYYYFPNRQFSATATTCNIMLVAVLAPPKHLMFLLLFMICCQINDVLKFILRQNHAIFQKPINYFWLNYYFLERERKSTTEIKKINIDSLWMIWMYVL